MEQGRQFRYLWLTACFLALSVFSCTSYEKNHEKKNILFIVVDDMRPVLGCYGNSKVNSPNIDRLAGNGVLFTHAYCQVAVCNPSRASVMTGMRPDRLKVWTNKPHFRENNPLVVTLPQFFKQKGYAAREVGKIYHDPESHKDTLSWSGPSFYNVTLNGRGHKYSLPQNCEPRRMKAAAAECADVPDSAYIDGKVCDAAIRLLNELKDSSFFLAVGFRRPHLPFSAPEKYWDLYRREELANELKDTLRPAGAPLIAFHNSEELRGYEDIPIKGAIPYDKQLELLHGYYASISYVDALIGRMISELEHLGLAGNTLIVLWADHGYHTGDFGLWCKATNFEAATRVPLIFSGPGIRNGRANASFAELVDIYPTLTEMAGFGIPEGLAGKSMAPVLTGEGEMPGEFALSQFVRPYGAISSDNPEAMGYSLRTPYYRYTEWRSFPDMNVLSRELYDLGLSNIEQNNLASEKKYDELMGTLSHEIDKRRQ